MSNLARVNWASSQRVDISHVLAMESFTAFDFRSLITFLTGTSEQYVIRGFEPTAKNGLALSLEVKNSITFNPADNSGSFYMGLPDDLDLIVNLPANQNSVFVEAVFKHQTGVKVSTNLWNPLALSGLSTAGSEYTAALDSQDVLVLEITANTIGFTANAIPLMKAKTGAVSIINIQDCRPMLFRLGTGGANPDSTHKFGFAVNRSEPVPVGAGVGNEVDSSFRYYNAGVINDKGLKSFKNFADALMTRFSEITGSLWYDNGSTSNYVGSLSLNELFFDTLGHSIQPFGSVSVVWSKDSDNILRSHGVSPVQWQSNYWKISWQLGGVFDTGARSFTSGANSRFSTPALLDGQNVYLTLERDVVKGSGNSVDWIQNPADLSAPSTPWPGTPNRVVIGATGDFTGIAIGDYVRRTSEGTSKYHRVVKYSDWVNPEVTAVGSIADSTIKYLLLSEDISAPSREPLKFFRSSYQSADLFINDGTGALSADYYWLGRRVGIYFIFKNYGTMDPGEEFIVFDDSFIGDIGSTSDLSLAHTKDSAFLLTNNYALTSGSASTDIVTIKRRVNKNTVGTPTPITDNTQAFRTYHILAGALPISIPDGSGLWVRLDDTAGTDPVALTSGTIYNASEDANNNITMTNVFQVLTAAQNPLKSYNNKNVYLLARAITIGAVPALLFCDGSILQEDGQYIPNNLAVKGYTRVKGGLADDNTIVGEAVLPIPFADSLDYRVSQNPIGGTSVVGMINTLAKSQLDEDNTGFIIWGGSGSYYTLLAGTFTLITAGAGRIKGKPITWDGATSNTASGFASDTTNYLYIDSTGALQKSTTYPTVDVGIPMFEVFFDGTNYYVAKENHPYDFNSAASQYLHNNVGTVIRGLGALATKVGTGTGGVPADRQVKIAGADTLEDHGLATTIPDSGGAGVTWNMYYWNGASDFTRAAQQTEMLMQYNVAGTLTPISAGNYGVHTLYVTKDNLNSSTPQYFLVIGNVNELTDNAVIADIDAGLIDGMQMAAAAQLAKLEFAQLGYVIVKNSTGGFIDSIIISKSTFNSKVVGGGNQGAASLISVDTTSFDAMLDGTDTTVQNALETIDDYAKSSNFKILDTSVLTKKQVFDVSAIVGTRTCRVTADADSILPIAPTAPQANYFLRATGANTATWQALLASMSATVTTNFDAILSVADTTIQAALETIDDYAKSANFKILDTVALTKKQVFDVSALTAPSTRTCFFPNADSRVPTNPVAGDVSKYLLATGVGTIAWAPIASFPIVLKTGDYTAGSDDSAIMVDATSGNVTISLPAMVQGKEYIIKKIDSSFNTVYVKPNGAELLDTVWTNAAPYPIDITNDSITIRALTGTSAGWYIL